MKSSYQLSTPRALTRAFTFAILGFSSPDFGGRHFFYPVHAMTPPQVDHRRHSLRQLKLYVTLQLQAYYEQDWRVYDDLETNIRRLEQQLTSDSD